MPTWTPEQYADWKHRHSRCEIPCPVVEPTVRNEPVGQAQGTQESTSRFVVRITGYRRRLLDPDNFAGGCKYLVDGLRYAGLIPDDSPAEIMLTTRQTQVAKATEEFTEIVIEPL